MCEFDLGVVVPSDALSKLFEWLDCGQVTERKKNQSEMCDL